MRLYFTMTLPSKNQQLVVRNILSEVAQHTANGVPTLVYGTFIKHKEITFRVAPTSIRSVIVFLRNSDLLQMGTLVDIQATDRLGTAGRFTVKYSLLSTGLNQRCVVELCVDEITVIPSVACPLFNNQRVFAGAG